MLPVALVVASIISILLTPILSSLEKSAVASDSRIGALFDVSEWPFILLFILCTGLVDVMLVIIYDGLDWVASYRPYRRVVIRRGGKRNGTDPPA